MTNFSDRLTVGTDTGSPATRTVGVAVLMQEATVGSATSGATSIVLPANSRVVDLNVIVRGSASANTQGVNVRIGAGHDENFFATVKTSGIGLFRPGALPNAAGVVSAAAMFNVGTSNLRVFADVTAVTSGAGQLDNYEAMVTIFYIPRS